MGAHRRCGPARPGAAVGVGQSCWSVELAAEVLRRLDAGQRLTAICGEPGMPDRGTVRAWAEREPGFGAELRRRMRLAALAAGEVQRAEALEKRRRREARGGWGRRTTYTQNVGEAICERLANGESLKAVCRDPAMPKYNTVWKWRRDIPEFAEMYELARECQADALFDEAREVALAATPEGVWVARLQFDVIKWQTAKLAPRRYLDRVSADDLKRAAAAAAVAQAAQAAPVTVERTEFFCMQFRRAPNGKILAEPPRNPREAQDWRDALGHDFDGHWPWPKGEEPPEEWAWAKDFGG